MVLMQYIKREYAGKKWHHLPPATGPVLWNRFVTLLIMVFFLQLVLLACFIAGGILIVLLVVGPSMWLPIAYVVGIVWFVLCCCVPYLLQDPKYTKPCVDQECVLPHWVT